MDLVAIQETLGHCLGRHDHELRSRAADPYRRCLDGRAAAGRGAAERAPAVKWNLRLAAANRGIWKASELQRMLAERGLVISAGKMSGLWSGSRAVKLDDLDVICAVLGCEVGELLIPEPGKVVVAAESRDEQPVARFRVDRVECRPSRPGAVAPARSRPPDGGPNPCRHPIGSCPDCLSWGAVLRIAVLLPGLLRLHPPLPARPVRPLPARHRGEEGSLSAAAGCRRESTASGRQSDHRRDFAPTGYWQLSLAGMSRLGAPARPRRSPPDPLRQPARRTGPSWSCAPPASHGTSTPVTGSPPASPARPCS